MRAHKYRVLVCVVAASLSGCVRNPAPQAWRVSAREVQQSVRGGWILLELHQTKTPPMQSRVEGELLAIDAGAVHVLSHKGFESVPRSSIERMTAVRYSSPAGALAVWASIGAASTLSHGVNLLVTAPMWAIAGILAAAREGRAGLTHDLESARPFARFPQGLPDGFDPAAVGPSVSRR